MIYLIRHCYRRGRGGRLDQNQDRGRNGRHYAIIGFHRQRQRRHRNSQTTKVENVKSRSLVLVHQGAILPNIYYHIVVALLVLVLPIILVLLILLHPMLHRHPKAKPKLLTVNNKILTYRLICLNDYQPFMG
jgi:hypothetical protein